MKKKIMIVVCLACFFGACGNQQQNTTDAPESICEGNDDTEQELNQSENISGAQQETMSESENTINDTPDGSMVAKYYGVLNVYQGQNLNLEENREKISVEDAWELLRQKYYSNAEVNEISYDENGRMQIVTWHGESQFTYDDELRPCDSLVFYDREENEEYIFGNWLVFYDGDEVYGTKTKAWYSVNVYTGEITE